MNIIVCIKQVPDTTEVKIDPVTNTLIRQGVPSIVNPFDKNAVEAALRLRELHGGKVTILSMGPPQAKEALKECIVMGADEAVLVSDRAFGGADTLATSYTLASAIRALGKFDIILCGKQAIDGDTAQVGPEIAEYLNMPQVTYAAKIELANESTLRVHREQDDCYEVIEAQLPVMITAVKSLNEPRLGTVWGCVRACRSEIKLLTAADMPVNYDRLGLKGSPTQVRQIFTPEARGLGKIITGVPAAEAAEQLAQMLTKCIG